MNKRLLAHIALFIVNAIYAANFLIAKGVMPDYIAPSGFIFYRASGALLLFLILFAFSPEKVEKKDFPRLILCGFFGVALNQLFFFNGLNITSPINGAIIMTANPILVLGISHILLREVITKAKILGVILGGIGAVLLLASGNDGGDGNASLQGDLFILINALSYGMYLVIVKPLLSKYKAVTVVTWVFFFGLLFITPFGIKQALEVDWSTMPSSILSGVLYVIIGTTFLAYLLNISALKIVSPSVGSTYIYLQPVLAGVFAILGDYFLNNQDGYSQDITLYKVGCAIIIFIGVYLVGSKKAKYAKE